MKRLVLLTALALTSLAGVIHADGGQQRTYQKVQNVGAVDVGTVTAVQLSTTATLVWTTSTANAGYYSYNVTSGSFAVGTINIGLGFSASTSTAQFLDSHLNTALLNNCTDQDAYYGYNAQVTTQPTTVNYGWKIPKNGGFVSWVGGLMNVWVMAGGGTNFCFNVQQQR